MYKGDSSRNETKGTSGMGLAISRILCKKHGGCLEIRNDVGHHAVVNVTFSVNDTL